MSAFDAEKIQGYAIVFKHIDGKGKLKVFCIYSRIQFSRFLNCLKLPVTRTKSRFPSLVKHNSFTLDFTNQFCDSNGGLSIQDSTLPLTACYKSRAYTSS